MKTIAVLGGGPAGAFAAERLARAGLKTLVFDEKLAWEKPCGGGITYRAYQEYPFLRENATPKKLVRHAVLGATGAGSAAFDLAHPLVIYSRNDLNAMLLERAACSGAGIEKTRVTGMERSGSRWVIRTKHGIAEADFCIVATGARNPFRQVGTELGATDTMMALGYYVPGAQDHIDVEFLPGLQGYIWVFPRCGHLSVGIGGKGEPSQALRKRLEIYMEERGIRREGAAFYSHILPSLEHASWRRNRVGGEGWLAVGDAAGLADPITGEGLYYAVRSGDLASRVILDERVAPEAKAMSYSRTLAHDFMEDLTFAATMARRLFLGRFLLGGIPGRTVQFLRRSARFRDVLKDLMDGTQPYLGLRERLVGNLSGTLQEVLVSFVLNRAPRGSRAVL